LHLPRQRAASGIEQQLLELERHQAYCRKAIYRAAITC
jgi:hypothetical protein